MAVEGPNKGLVPKVRGMWSKQAVVDGGLEMASYIITDPKPFTKIF